MLKFTCFALFAVLGGVRAIVSAAGQLAAQMGPHHHPSDKALSSSPVGFLVAERSPSRNQCLTMPLPGGRLEPIARNASDRYARNPTTHLSTYVLAHFVERHFWAPGKCAGTRPPPPAPAGGPSLCKEVGVQGTTTGVASVLACDCAGRAASPSLETSPCEIPRISRRNASGARANSQRMCAHATWICSQATHPRTLNNIGMDLFAHHGEGPRWDPITIRATRLSQALQSASL